MRRQDQNYVLSHQTTVRIQRVRFLGSIDARLMVVGRSVDLDLYSGIPFRRRDDSSNGPVRTETCEVILYD